MESRESMSSSRVEGDDRAARSPTRWAENRKWTRMNVCRSRASRTLASRFGRRSTMIILAQLTAKNC